MKQRKQHIYPRKVLYSGYIKNHSHKKKMNRHITKEELQIISKHMKTCQPHMKTGKLKL